MPLVDFISDLDEDEELERAKTFKDRWDLYDGKHPDSLPVVRGNEGRPDVNDNIKYNISRVTVDRGVSALFGSIDQEITFALQEDAPDPDADATEGDADEESRESPDQEWLEDCWDANGKSTLLSNIATNGGVCGHVYIRFYEDGAKYDREMPRIVNLDPAYCMPVFAEDDYERVLGWKIQFPVGRQKIRRTLIEPNNEDTDPTSATQWLITDQLSVGTDGFNDIGEPEVWDHEFPPVLDTQNLPRPNEYWGLSDIEDDVRDLNFSMNRALSAMQRILRLFGHPRPYATGTTPEQIALLVQGVDRIITLPANATLNQLEMTGDLSSAIDYLRQLKSAFADVAKNPQVDPEKLGSMGGLSGVALRILYQPLLEQTGTKRGTYGPFLSETNKRLLQLGNIVPSPVKIGWPNPIPLDIKEMTDALVAQRDLGLSQETALEILGHDPALEEERRAKDSVSPAAGLGAILDANAMNGSTA